MKATIYKYLNEKGALASIESDSVLLRMPSEYNDPFDCYYYIDKKERHKAFKLFMNYQFFKIFYNEIVINNKQLILGKLNTKIMLSNLKLIAKSINNKKRYKWMPDIEMYYKFAKYISRKSDEEYYEEFNKMIDGTVERIKRSILISCFSLRNDSILMWSHYAHSHRGACLEYEIDDKDFKTIKYSRKPIRFKLSKVLEHILGHDFSGTEMDYSDDSFLFAIKPVLIKFKDWKYEKEVRCAYALGKKNPRIHDGVDDEGKRIWLLDMMPARIKKIYIGCEASDDFVEKIENMNCGAAIVRMEKQNGKYGVSPKEDC